MINSYADDGKGNTGHKDIHDIHLNTQLNLLPMIWDQNTNNHENQNQTSQTVSEYRGNILDKGLDLNSNGQYPQLVLKAINPRPQYVPPLNFSLVEGSIYRSGFPIPINYPFLKQLRLKTIIYLGDLGLEKKSKKDKKKNKDKEGEKEEDKEKGKDDKESEGNDESKEKKKKDKHGTMEIMEGYKNWLSTTDITFHHLEMGSSQEPFLLQEQHEITQKSLTTALELMLDKRNFPILIHSNKGKHRIGVLVGLMRKILQGWCMSGIFEEYEKFAMGKSEFDLEFIEIWQPELLIDENNLPNFVRTA